MKKTLLIILILIILIVVIFVSTKNEVLEDRFLQVGFMAPLSGPFAFYGEEALSGVESVLIGPAYTVNAEDSECDPAKAVSAFKKLVDINKVKYLIGPGCGSPQEAIAPLVADKDLIVILPSAATRSLHEIGGGKIYNTQYSLEQESKFIAEKMMELGHEKVALISYNNAFSATHVKSFKENYKGEIVSETVFADFGADVSTEVAKLKNLDIDAIFSTDTAFFFDQGNIKIKQFGIDVPVFSQYAIELPAVRELVEGVIYSFSDEIGDRGAVYEFSKDAAEILDEFVNKCKGDFECVKSEFENSEGFDQDGIRKQNLILKQIVNGEPTVFE